MEGNFDQSIPHPSERKGKILPLEQNSENPEDPSSVQFKITRETPGIDVMTTIAAIYNEEGDNLTRRLGLVLEPARTNGKLNNIVVPLAILNGETVQKASIQPALVLGAKPEFHDIRNALFEGDDYQNPTKEEYDLYHKRFRKLFEYLVDEGVLDEMVIKATLANNIPDSL